MRRRIPQWCNDSPWEQDLRLRLPSDFLLSRKKKERDEAGRGAGEMALKKIAVTAVGSSGR